MNKKKDTTLPTSSSSKELAENFAGFFSDKVDKIRETFDHANNSETYSEEPPSPPLSVLSPTTEAELKKIITSGN